MATSFLDVFDPYSQYPIFNCLCDHLRIGDIVALTQTCKRLFGLYSYLLPSQWNLNGCLRRFVRNPTGLRSEMATSSALISGSFALQFLERSSWRSADLDIYVKHGQGSESLHNYLVQLEGYLLQNKYGMEKEYEGMEYVVSVRHLQ